MLSENDFQEDITIETCNHCGKDVSRRTGKFVNRVPDFNDIITRIDNSLSYPLGDFVCAECDRKSSDEYEEQ